MANIRVELVSKEKRKSSLIVDKWLANVKSCVKNISTLDPRQGSLGDFTAPEYIMEVKDLYKALTTMPDEVKKFISE